MTQIQTQTSIADFIYENDFSNTDNVEILNLWYKKTGEKINSPSFLSDMLDIINKMKKLNKEELADCIRHDKELGR